MLTQRKHPPHFAPILRNNEPIVLFVTLAIRPRIDALSNEAFHMAFNHVLCKADAWRVFLHVIMPDHIHMFAVAQTMPSFPIAKWTEFLKRETTKAFGEHPQWDWLPGCWDTQMRDSNHLDEKASYVRMNPIRAGLCASPEEWKWRGEGEWVMW